MGRKEVKEQKNLLDALTISISFKEASDAILHIYEKPADQSAAVENKRASFGNIFYEQFAKKKEADPVPAAPAPVQATKESAVGEFLVRVETPYLNVREGAGTNTPKTGLYTGVGTFTITEIKAGEGSKSGWGKLKSGKGWISLDHTKRV